MDSSRKVHPVDRGSIVEPGMDWFPFLTEMKAKIEAEMEAETCRLLPGYSVEGTC
jgi:hypothetical protein